MSRGLAPERRPQGTRACPEQPISGPGLNGLRFVAGKIAPALAAIGGIAARNMPPGGIAGAAPMRPGAEACQVTLYDGAGLTFVSSSVYHSLTPSRAMN